MHKTVCQSKPRQYCSCSREEVESEHKDSAVVVPVEEGEGSFAENDEKCIKELNRF